MNNYRTFALLCIAALLALSCVTDRDNLPPADPTKPLKQGGLFPREVAWPTPKTAEELELFAVEIKMRADAESAKRFRAQCAWFNLIWIPGIALGMFLAIYLRSKLFAFGAAVCLAMVAITYTLSDTLPRAAPWIAGTSLALLAVSGAVFLYYLARKYKSSDAALSVEQGALHEVVATFQKTKGEIWDNGARNLALRTYSEETKARVTDIKEQLPQIKE